MGDSRKVISQDSIFLLTSSEIGVALNERRLALFGEIDTHACFIATVTVSMYDTARFDIFTFSFGPSISDLKCCSAPSRCS